MIISAARSGRSGTRLHLTGAIATLACVGLLALPAALGAAADAGPSAASASCDGQAATIVGTRGQALDGTEGDDVIVSNGASSVNPGDGSDLVCLTGTPDATVSVYAVAPGERIDATASQAPVHATVGGGATYTGGPKADDVTIMSVTGQPAHVSTGGGDDTVRTGVYTSFTGEAEPTASDVVSLGSGDDELYVASAAAGAAGGGSVDGGSGTDTFYLYDGAQHAWTVDFGAGRFAAGGPEEPMTGFERLGAFFPWTSLTVLGSSHADYAELDDLFGAQQGPVTMRLGAGDDTALVSRNLRGSADGGSGHNTFVSTISYHQPDKPMKLALRAGALTTAGHTLEVHGFARDEVKDSVKATVLGTNRPDVLVVNACVATIKGLGGNDSLRFSLPATSSCAHPPRIRDHLYGGGGNDGLSGTGKHDVLIGGPGRDHADGRGGGDRCLAERTVACGPHR